MKNWSLFGLLGVIWGSSFLLIKVAVDDLTPLPLVAVRLGLAAAFMTVFMLATHRRFPRNRRELAALIFVGVMNTAVPFSLITWGEKDIDSGLATVLNATQPLFTLVIAHAVLADERINPQKLVGLLAGFAGVAILASRNADSSSPNPLIGQLAVLAAAASYALSAVVIRRFLRGVEPITVAGGSQIVGALAIVTVTLLTVHPLPDVSHLSAQTILAMLTLALVNTVVAYFLYYHLISEWGATRTTLVTYLMPPIGLTLGAIFLDETVDWKIVVGAVLILAGIVAANWRKRAPARAVVVTSASAD
ncbi:MAG TPA: DMT family transporter [Aggregatilinea sp.]|uniref:DMT family transporter n=1 Tax=Aggregatilinea sp. TaxID=2806333 RepID=UPI002C866503|nr:DMT family transporter [Aggregatilinea sp.]HML21587.1 DMT family transporter [Aggregatilinea sp.]